MVTYAFLAAAFALGVTAFPGQLDGRAACNADNCLRAVRATAAKPGAAQASADCISYFQETVSYCEPPQTYTRVTVTVTGEPGPVTQGPTATNTPIFTSYEPEFTAAAKEKREPAQLVARSCALTSTATVLPTYIAKACGADARYKSACSCAGITSYSQTYLYPTTTFTFTITDTVTVAPTPEC